MPDVNLLRPDRKTLIRFFTERRDLSVPEAARLLGWPPRALLSRVREEAALLPDSRIAWADVAFWLLQAWPRAQLLGILGKQASLIPPDLHLTEVRWRLPLYVVRALELQAALQRTSSLDVRSTDIADYVADELHLLIEPETVETLQHDPAFRAAYDYPEGEDHLLNK